MPRKLVGELMDEPGLDPAAHRHALRGLARLNAASAAGRSIWHSIRPWARRRGLDRPLRVLDVATGSGDVALRVHRLAAREGVRMELHLCDISPEARQAARDRAARAGVEVQTIGADACRDPLPGGFDVVMCSLFLHHLTEDEAERVLGAMRSACARDPGATIPTGLVVVADLARTRRGLALAAVGSRTLTRSPIVHEDAVRSVRAGWTREELRTRFDRAGMSRARVRKVWPERWLVTWEAPCEA